MTATYNVNNGVSLLLSVLCLGIVFMGGWYFQSSMVELRTLVANQQEVIMEQREEITNQKNRLDLLQQQFQSKDQNVRDMNNDINYTVATRVKRNNPVPASSFPSAPQPLESIPASQPSQPDTSSLQILRGRDGRDGRDGQDGSPGSRGLTGPPGLKGDMGVPGLKGDTGASGLKGEAGDPGLKGETGNTGQKGEAGVSGPKGDGTGGVVYVRWGHDSCPSGGAQLVYAGRAGGSHYESKGGGGNPQCLPLDPNFYKTVSGSQAWGYMFGAEYQDTNTLVSNSHDTDVPCAVCYVPTRNVLYMIPAKYTCPSGWTREYYGYLMSERYNHHRSQFSCVDYSLKPVTGSSQNHNGFLFYTVEGVCGALPCPPYSRDKELSCAVCTK